MDRAGLDYAVPWHSQPKETIGKIIGAVSPFLFSLFISIIHNHLFWAHEHHNFLNRFPHGWPIEEFIKTYLKNKHTYAYKQGYLTENTNQKKQHWHDEDEEEEEEQQQKEQEEESQEEGNDEENEECNGWLNRGVEVLLMTIYMGLMFPPNPSILGNLV